MGMHDLLHLLAFQFPNYQGMYMKTHQSYRANDSHQASHLWSGKSKNTKRMERNDGFTKITLENFCFFVCHQHACSWQHLSYHSHAWSPCFKHMLQGWQQIVMEFLQQRCRCQALSTRGVLLRVKSRVKFHGPLVRFASTESANLYFGIRPLCYLVQHSSIPG